MVKNYHAIKQDLLNTGLISNVAIADHELIYGGNNTDNITWAGKQPGSKVLISQRYVTPEFMETAGLKILEGRNLTTLDTGKSIRLVITQSLEKMMGKGSAVSKVLRAEGVTTQATMGGVVNDYIYGNMY